MGKWIEDLNIAIDMARTSQEKSSIFLDAGLGDHSNREFLTWCDVTMPFCPTAEGGHCFFPVIFIGVFFSTC